MEPDFIRITGAREHNLKGVNLDIPKKKLVVITGPSGSGKSSLAFDTLYAEGQRRYVESLSSYARQFLGQLEKPRYDAIRGLSPTISIEQKAASGNPRSTVGTITEISDYLRVLYARVGVQHCPACERIVCRSSAEAIVKQVQSLAAGTKLMVLAPVIENRKGEFREVLDGLRRDGIARIRANKQILELATTKVLDKKRKHQVEAVIDRLTAGATDARRLTDSVETALKLGKGKLIVAFPDGSADRIYSERLACEPCGRSFPELSPQQFSFNSPLGMCHECNGLGSRLEIDPTKLIPDPTKTLAQGAVIVFKVENAFAWGHDVAKWICREFDIDLHKPWNKLPEKHRRIILDGADGWEGLLPRYKRRFLETESEDMKEWYAQYLSSRACDSCGGARLREESRHVRFFAKTIVDLHGMSIEALAGFFRALVLSETEEKIASELLKEIRSRLRFLVDVGLGYLALGRPGPTLSGGESQRIRLASQIGSELTGVIYVLDEPSIGLHQRDNDKLIHTLEHLRDLGNSVIVVEHDLETIQRADHVIDFGPGAGRRGGEVVAAGTPAEVAATEGSLTGDYLSGRKEIAIPKTRRKPGQKWIEVLGADANNLRGIDVRVPVGLLTCVSGVSGAGKSSLVNQILLPELERRFSAAAARAGSGTGTGTKCRGIKGLEAIDKVIAIDQKPIGRTPRSNPATYTKCMDAIRDFFAELPQSKMYGYLPGRFSFNVKGGRCEKCQGDGSIKIEMHFLADVYVTCEDCHGRRFNEATLQVKYKGHSIADVLDLSVAEAMEVFVDHPSIRRTLQTLLDVGLDYMHLGQSATTLSGGEAQRIKLSRELAKRATGRTLYILDEPSTGLHLDDVRRLLVVLQRLVDSGNTVVVIEHNLDIIKVADWVIDLGPEGGNGGGELVAEGAPEEVVKVKRSFTGRYLGPLLRHAPRAACAHS